MRLDGKVVIVTGSATGIGAAIATRAAAEGARVLVHGLEADLARGVAEEIDSRHGPGRAAVVVEELAAPGAAERIVEAAVAAFGRIDGSSTTRRWWPGVIWPPRRARSSSASWPSTSSRRWS